MSDSMVRSTRRACLCGLMLASSMVLIPRIVVSAEDSHPFPIWVNPQLGLKSADVPNDAEGALAQPFRSGFDVYIREGSERAKAVVKNCSDYVKLADVITGAGSDREYRVLIGTGARCVALDWLTKARPAKISYVSEFQLNQKNLTYIPPALALAVSPDDEARIRQVEERGGSILDVESDIQLVPSKNLGIDRDDIALLKSPDWTAKLTIYARADFLGNGVEELLLRRDVSENEGTYSTTSLYLLGRSKPEGPLRVLRKMG